MVLIRGISADGIDIYTHRTSRKGRDLAARPVAAMSLWWAPLERQVRFSGPMHPLDVATSAAYFATRPRASQLGAWASAQGEPVADRATLEAALAAAESVHGAEGPVPLPPHWGGFRLVPDRWEFWQGRQGRLHDRFEYRRSAEGSPDGPWEIVRLQP